MGISQYLGIAKWVAIVGLICTVYWVVRDHGATKAENEALHDRIKVETQARIDAEALANDLSEKLFIFQEIDQGRQREIRAARRRTDAAMRALEAVPALKLK